jgi:hypothetical protein
LSVDSRDVRPVDVPAMPTLTRERALTSREFHYNAPAKFAGTTVHGCARVIGARGAVHEHIVRVRRNGMTQTWKTRPTHFRVPVKYGISNSGKFSITHDAAADWHAAEDCPLYTERNLILASD